MTLTPSQLVYFKTRYSRFLVHYLNDNLSLAKRYGAFKEIQRIDKVFKADGLRTTITISTETLK